MPPRYAYWTIILDNAPTAFRARERADLLPTLRQLLSRNPDAVIKWFAKGRLWESPEEARSAEKRGREQRGQDWRPGGKHEDPRARFGKQTPWRDGERHRTPTRPPGSGSARPFRPGESPEGFSTLPTATRAPERDRRPRGGEAERRQAASGSRDASGGDRDGERFKGARAPGGDRGRRERRRKQGNRPPDGTRAPSTGSTHPHEDRSHGHGKANRLDKGRFRSGERGAKSGFRRRNERRFDRQETPQGRKEARLDSKAGREHERPERGRPVIDAPGESDPPPQAPIPPPGPDRPPRPGEEPPPEAPDQETVRILPQPPERAK